MKYCHALQSLDSDIDSEVSDFIMDPPQYGKYEALKSRIIHKFRDSEKKCLRVMLNQA